MLGYLGQSAISLVLSLYSNNISVYKTHKRRLLKMNFIIVGSLLFLVTFYMVLTFLLSCQIMVSVPDKNKIFKAIYASKIGEDPDPDTTCGLALTGFNILYNKLSY